MHEPKDYQAIALSSTFTDLREHRQKAIGAISKLGYMLRVMEHSGAQAASDVIDTSLAMVRESAAYVGVISLKYGQTPFDPVRNPERLSITELEFNEAVRLARPIVLFIMGDEHSVKKADVESEPEKRQKLDAFRERAKRMHGDREVQRVYETFESLEQFSSAAAIAIGNLVRHLERSAVPARTEPGRLSRAALSNIPINVPRHFLGRDDDLAAIEAALEGTSGRAEITALHGLRGVGKTILAAAYAERHAEDYRAAWWIRAETESTIRADLVGLGVQLGWIAPDAPEEPALAAVLERLRRDGHGILLIYDNAMGPNEISKLLPRGAGPRIIITSNAPNWRGVAAPVSIATWPDHVGADFLTERTGRITDRGAALVLSEALGGLPLAHEQAAAFCERTGISLAEYNRRFDAAPVILLEGQEDASRDYHDGLTVAKTFALAIDEAAKLHPAAELLIKFAALLAPEPIPLFLFSEAREKFGEPFASHLAGGGLDEAVAALRAFALLDRESIADERDPSVATDCIRLHRLVRQVAAVGCKGDLGVNARRILIAALAEVYPDRVFDSPDTWPRARRLDSVVLPLVAENVVLPEGVAKQAGDLLDRLASYRQVSLADYARARTLFELALIIREKTLGSEHPDTAESLNNLGVLLQAQGDLAGAKSYCQRALAIHEKALGPDHPHTATSLNNLASVLESQGDLAGARPYYERALAIVEKALGPDRPDTATSLNNLGSLLQDQGDLAGARPCLERALTIREKSLGPDHPDTATSLNNLGFLLKAQGDLAGARPYYERALAILDKVLGASHPSTKTVAGNTVALLEAIKSWKEAKALRKEFGL